ncbi:MAG: hypothetical protein KQJ78_15975 [Deltaproteobacteria bacterium]|nr:hypothetical protein [Deltaproteobacteria bacterium]
MPKLVRFAGLLLLVALLAGLAGCSSPPRGVTLTDQVGRMTYDEALRMWGPPLRVEKGDQLKAAVWERNFDQEYLEEISCWFDNQNTLVDWRSQVWEINENGQRTMVQY